jgi:DUF1680 family protein
LYVREPGWYYDKSVPGDLYEVRSGNPSVAAQPKLNGVAVKYNIENGYIVIERTWKKGDELTIDFPMEVKEITAKKELEFDNNRIALQRGPILYCVEGADNKEGVWNIIAMPFSTFSATDYKILDEKVIGLQGEVSSAVANASGTGIDFRKRKITAIPYYCWANRGHNSMQVWLPTKITDVKINYQSKYPDGGNY